MKKLIILIFLIITKAGITQNNESINLIASQIEQMCLQIDSSCKKIEIVNNDAGGAIWWLDNREPFDRGSFTRGRLRKITTGWGDVDASYESTFYLDPHCGNIICCKTLYTSASEDNDFFEQKETIAFIRKKAIIKKIQKKYSGSDWDNWDHPLWQEVIVTYPNSSKEYENYNEQLHNSILESTVINFSGNCNE